MTPHSLGVSNLAPEFAIHHLFNLAERNNFAEATVVYPDKQ